MRMRVPLAGPHETAPQPLETPSQEQPQPIGYPPRSTIPPRPAAQTSPPPGRSPSGPETPPRWGGSGILRIVFILFIVFLVGGIVFLGFRFAGRMLQQRPSGPVELTYWGLWEEERVINTVLADFEREHPNIKVRYEKQTIKQYRETLTNRLAAGSGPDIFRFHNTWVPMLKEYLEPIPQEIISKEAFEQTFYKVAQEDLKVDTTYVGVPLEIDTLALFINENDFKAIGASPPKTWNDLRSIARQLTVKDKDGKIQKAGVALGTFGNVDHASDILVLMMLQAGVDLKKKKITTSTSRDGRVLAEDVLSYYVNEFTKGDGRVWDDTLDPSTLAFAKEKLSMYFGYSWRVFELQQLNPQLSFRVVTVPQLPEEESVALASYWVEGVSKKSRFQKEAFTLLTYLSERETMEKLFAQQSKLRLFGEPYSRVDMADSLKSNQYLAPFIEQAKYAKSWYAASNTFDNGLNDQMITYFADAVGAVGRGVSPKTALETVEKGVNALASRYGF